jgi:hypothetical protein
MKRARQLRISLEKLPEALNKTYNVIGSGILKSGILFDATGFSHSVDRTSASKVTSHNAS